MSEMCDRSDGSEGQSEEQLIEHYVSLQSELCQRVISRDTECWTDDIDSRLRLVGGLDISYDKSDSSIGCVTCVVLDIRDQFRVVYQNNTSIRITNRYIAGFLAFREIDFLLNEYRTLRQKDASLVPQVWLIDGNGILHPRKFGLASHFGLLTDQSVIGVAKNPYYLTFATQDIKSEHKLKITTLKEVGDRFDIRHTDGQVIGAALKTSKEATNPVYVSVGHKISLPTAIKVVLKCCKYRIPEPTRLADIISRQQIRR